MCFTPQTRHRTHVRLDFTIYWPVQISPACALPQARANTWGVLVSLNISTRESAGVTIVDLEGKATIGENNDLLNNSLRKIVAGGARHLLLNLSDLTQLDSSSIGTIAGTFVSLSRTGGTLKLLKPRGRVRTALDAMKWLDYIATFDNEAEALASFQQGQHSTGGA